jgi:hypothetical protein
MQDVEHPHETTRRPLSGAFDFMVRGWRPAAGWACTATVLVRGAVVPIFELANGGPVSAFDWVSVAALLGALGLARYRHIEKLADATI